MAAPGGDWEMKTTPTGQTYYEVLLLPQMLLSIQYFRVDIQCKNNDCCIAESSHQNDAMGTARTKLCQ